MLHQLNFHHLNFLKQPQYQPLRASEQIVIIYATNVGVFDDVELNRFAELQEELLKRANLEIKPILDDIDNGAKLHDTFKEAIKKLAEDVAKKYVEE